MNLSIYTCIVYVFILDTIYSQQVNIDTKLQWPHEIIDANERAVIVLFDDITYSIIIHALFAYLWSSSLFNVFRLFIDPRLLLNRLLNQSINQ